MRTLQSTDCWSLHCSAMMGCQQALTVVTVLALAVLAVLVRKVQVQLESLRLTPGPGGSSQSYNDETCQLVGPDLQGSEDLALGRHGVLFIASGDMHTGLTEGFGRAPPGGVWVVDLRQTVLQDPVKLEILGVPAGLTLRLLGLDVSNSTDRLYSVNHQETTSSVVVFQITYNVECVGLQSWTCPPVSLQLVTSITSPLFPHGGINDVAEVDVDQIYVTQLLPYPVPAGGALHQTWLESWQSALSVLALGLGLPWSSLLLCQVSRAQCHPATSLPFTAANGITVSQDRSRVFVNDAMERRIVVMKREERSYSLTWESVIELPVIADNIEYEDETGQILIGTIPDFITATRFVMGDKRLAVPGGLALASPLPSGGWEVRELLRHDGSRLAQISAGARYGDTVVLGSPGSRGLLVCYNVTMS